MIDDAGAARNNSDSSSFDQFLRFVYNEDAGAATNNSDNNINTVTRPPEPEPLNSSSSSEHPRSSTLGRRLSNLLTGRGASEFFQVGTKAPDFVLTSTDGHDVRLSDFRGSKVMICFYRYSYCKVCAYSISKLIGEYKKLAWGAQLKVITIFRTDIDYLKRGLTEESAPIPHLSQGLVYPFVALADPHGEVAKAFEVERTFMLKQVIDNYRVVPGVMANRVVRKEHFFNARGAGNLLPSEFLIDENGVVVDVMRATKSKESMAVDRIKYFLLLGRRHPSASEKRRGIKLKNKQLVLYLGA